MALLLSYPIPDESLYVCFWGISFLLAACLLAAWSIADRTARRERVEVDRVVKIVVDKLLAERGLRSVDEP